MSQEGSATCDVHKSDIRGAYQPGTELLLLQALEMFFIGYEVFCYWLGKRLAFPCFHYKRKLPKYKIGILEKKILLHLISKALFYYTYVFIQFLVKPILNQEQ